MLTRRFVAALCIAAAPTAMHALPSPGSGPPFEHVDHERLRSAEFKSASQQSGAVRGRVVVVGTGAPVGSAQLQLGTRGAQTNDAGAFTFANVDAGTYSLEVRMIGYERVTRSVTVARGQTVDLTIEVKRMALSLD